MHRLYGFFLCAFALHGCGGSTASAPAPQGGTDGTDPIEAPTPSVPSVENWATQLLEGSTEPLNGVGVGASAEDARNQAKLSVQKAFWGEEPWPTLETDGLNTALPAVLGELTYEETELDGQFAVASAAN
ncbi:MAG: hypothetical protein AAFY60_20060, partial [Myxococcota bacterium]